MQIKSYMLNHALRKIAAVPSTLSHASRAMDGQTCSKRVTLRLLKVDTDLLHGSSRRIAKVSDLLMSGIVASLLRRYHDYLIRCR